jgi:hypothetical protein
MFALAPQIIFGRTPCEKSADLHNTYINRLINFIGTILKCLQNLPSTVPRLLWQGEVTATEAPMNGSIRLEPKTYPAKC